MLELVIWILWSDFSVSDPAGTRESRQFNFAGPSATVNQTILPYILELAPEALNTNLGELGDANSREALILNFGQ